MTNTFALAEPAGTKYVLLILFSLFFEIKLQDGSIKRNKLKKEKEKQLTNAVVVVSYQVTNEVTNFKLAPSEVKFDNNIFTILICVRFIMLHESLR